MKKLYELIEKATLVITADDAMYSIRVSTEYNYGRTWEFDEMSDAVGQNIRKPTGNIRFRFVPVKETMQFPEDATRRMSYVMPVKDARIFWKFLRDKKPQLWFALDVAFEGELKGFDAEMQNCLETVCGQATMVEAV